MRFWFDKHRRFRDQLSAYIDGELPARAAERLEGHLAGCERCRLELEQLRATVGALRELPEAEVPRSFTLSPERVAAPRPALPGAPPLAFGMRIAAAAVAAALAVVAVVDVGDIGDGGAGGDASREMRDLAGEEVQTMDGAAVEEPPDEATGDVAAEEPAEPAADAEGTPAASGTGQELRDGETPAAPPREPETEDYADTDAGEPPAAAPDEAPEAADTGRAAGDGDGGIDALTAAEIGLAAALGVLLVGSVGLAYVGRKR